VLEFEDLILRQYLHVAIFFVVSLCDYLLLVVAFDVGSLGFALIKLLNCLTQCYTAVFNRLIIQMNRMTKWLLLALFPFNAVAQNLKSPEYIQLSTQNVYDVEIIVFAYNTALPNVQTYVNKPIFDTSLAYLLDFNNEDLPLVKKADAQENDSQYTIDIEAKGEGVLALAWFEHDASHFQLNNLWDKLLKNPSTTPLLHRAWRQPETLFESPEFVNIKAVDKIVDNIITENEIYPDGTLQGQVALSKGRYMHFTNQINLFRTTNTADDVFVDDAKNIIFSLTERKQVKSGELHYFDNPWFGALVKITQFKGEQAHE